MQFGLRRIVERAAELDGWLFFRKAKAFLEEVERTRAAGAERGAGENDRWNAVEDFLAQDRPDLDGGAGEFEAVAALVAPFDPVDLVGECLLQPGFEPCGKI